MLRWLASLLHGRSQITRIGTASSSFQVLRGEIPYGSQLGLIVFASMVNDLMKSWGLRVKFVDHLTSMEILPRNSLFVLNFLVNDIQSFANHNNMRLNPGKSITVSSLKYNRYLAPPVVMGGAIIEDVLSVFQVARGKLA